MTKLGLWFVACAQCAAYSLRQGQWSCPPVPYSQRIDSAATMCRWHNMTSLCRLKADTTTFFSSECQQLGRSSWTRGIDQPITCNGQVKLFPRFVSVPKLY